MRAGSQRGEEPNMKPRCAMAQRHLCAMAHWGFMRAGSQRDGESEMKRGQSAGPGAKIAHAGSKWESNSLSQTILAELESARLTQS